MAIGRNGNDDIERRCNFGSSPGSSAWAATVLFATLLAAAAIAGASCGAQGGAAKTATSPAAADGQAATSASASAVHDAGGGAAGGGSPSESSDLGPKASVALQASAMLSKIGEIGLDPKKLPKLADLPMGQKKKVMQLFNASLGMECTDCHVAGDFKKETRNKQIARHMWDEFVLPLRDAKGGPIFCDSCHAGHERVLARGDLEALKKFMEDNYEHGLTRADGHEHECATCHGEEMEMRIIEKRWKLPRTPG